MGARLGHTVSDVTKAKISVANKGRKPWSTGLSKYSITGKGVRTPEYKTWANMKSRCTKYPDYLANGITVCERWNNPTDGFINFYSDMGDRPANMSIDRIDGTGNYEPSNCRWATSRQQVINTKLLGKNNTTGYRGVSLCKKTGKYIANIWLNYKMITLVRTYDIELAALAYDCASVQLNGAEVKLNILELT